MNTLEISAAFEGNLNKVIRGRYGLMVFNSATFHGKSFSEYGEHAQNELHFIESFIAKDDFIIDIGAHQGAHCLAFCSMVGASGYVLSFEPQIIMAHNLIASVALNDIMHCRVEIAAVGDKDCMVQIANIDYSSYYTPSQMQISTSNTGDYVRCVRLDSFLEDNHNTRYPKLIKIDVEGMESLVIKGATNTLRNYMPYVYFECHLKSSRSAEAVQLLRGLGYRVFLHQPLGFNSDNYFGSKIDIFGGGRDYNAMALSPLNKNHSLELISSHNLQEYELGG